MNTDLVVGALVEFASHPGSYGVIEELNGAVATVRWDPGVDLSPKVNWKSGSLSRVELPLMVVRTGADEPGLRLESIDGKPPKWQVQFLSGLRTVPEAALRAKP